MKLVMPEDSGRVENAASATVNQKNVRKREQDGLSLSTHWIHGDQSGMSISFRYGPVAVTRYRHNAIYCRVMKDKIVAIERKITKVKQKLADLGDLRPGSLSEQYNTCGTAGCRCKQDPAKRHGPYHQLSFNRKGRSSTRFVQKTSVAVVKRQLKNYARLRELVDEWIDLSTELCVLKLDQDKAAREAKKAARKATKIGENS
jgi:Family of unknown function (DUF6788)